jgi:hypothetical protein
MDMDEPPSAVVVGPLTVALLRSSICVGQSCSVRDGARIGVSRGEAARPRSEEGSEDQGDTDVVTLATSVSLAASPCTNL